MIPLRDQQAAQESAERPAGSTILPVAKLETVMTLAEKPDLIEGGVNVSQPTLLDFLLIC